MGRFIYGSICVVYSVIVYNCSMYDDLEVVSSEVIANC